MNQIVFLLLASLLTTNFAKSEATSLYDAKQTTQHEAYPFPFLVLLSNDHIKIQQLPLIENGNLSSVYSLASLSDPDAREYEQTSTSLGKFELQQIASNNNSNTDGQEVVASKPRKRRRRSVNNLTSNSSNDGFNASNKQQRAGPGSAAAAAAAAPNAAAGVGASVLESAFPHSYLQNVTSAQIDAAIREVKNEEDEVQGGRQSQNRQQQPRVRRVASSGPISKAEDEDQNHDDDGTVQFSDFDVHTAFGYAFVSDTTGRIHRVRLNPAAAAAADANKADNDVTHEQSGRHPAASGREQLSLEQQNEASSGMNDINQKQHLTGSKIIWSRTKHGPVASTAIGQHQKQSAVVQGALAAGEVNSILAPMSDKQRQQHMGSDNSSDSEEEDANDFDRANDNKTSPSSLDDCATAPLSLTDQWASNCHNKRLAAAALKTEVAVDWLNNLLFVLDKYRLLVLDLEGNNELVLIDDFNANNRPIEIKVEPVNNFLFWLQMGTFRNTIYKLDLSVLSLPTTEQKLTNYHNQRLTQSAAGSEHSELVALISHHYAHPIVMNLPKSARLFTIDHEHSKIYVPLASSAASSMGHPVECNQIQQDAVTFTSNNAANAGGETLTHLNSTMMSENLAENLSGKNCSFTGSYDYSSNGIDLDGLILTYNFDGTDVGPLRSEKDRAHLRGLDNIQDITLDSDKEFLYWLTNGGSDLFEEYKSDNENKFYSAEHKLDGEYKKLIHFGSANQPVKSKSRQDFRKLFYNLSTNTLANRRTRSGADSDADFNQLPMNSKLNHPEATRFARNAPYIILAITCLLVVIVYLVYSFIFLQRQRNYSRRNNATGGNATTTSRDGSSISSGASSISDFDQVNNQIPEWLAEGGPTALRTMEIDSLMIDQHQQHRGFDEIEGSSSPAANNAIAEHYRDSFVTNLTKWPSNMLDMANRNYVPLEIKDDKELASIPRIALDQIEFERCKHLGMGHFGLVQQGLIRCAKNVKTCPLHRPSSKFRRVNMATAGVPNGFIHQLSTNVVQAGSVGSSGHGSSSNSSEFVGPTVGVDVGDYLQPKSHCDSSMSDYALDSNHFNQASSAITSIRPESYSSSYYNSSVCPSSPLTNPKTLMPINSSCSNSNVTEMKVAIKSLKSNASSKEKRDFLQEAKMLNKFDHPNIVNLIGICLDRGQTLIVMELMLGGDLNNYLTDLHKKLLIESRTAVHDRQFIEDDLSRICLDIVDACCYLEESNNIHRDLAARNCLVSSIKREERVIKLADFGLARDIYNDSYYKTMTPDSAMPLKWMAPECLIDQKFSIKSDVWSFGVVLWEVMNFCQARPYAKIDAMMMENYLKNGNRLQKPENYCSDELYNLMLSCWQLEPQDRPTFFECRNILLDIRERNRSHRLI